MLRKRKRHNVLLHNFQNCLWVLKKRWVQQLRPSSPIGFKGWTVQCLPSILVFTNNPAGAPQGSRQATFLSTSLSFPKFLRWFILLTVYLSKVEEKIFFEVWFSIRQSEIQSLELSYLLWTPLPKKPFSQNESSFCFLPLLLPKGYGRPMAGGDVQTCATLFLWSCAQGCDECTFPSLKVRPVVCEEGGRERNLRSIFSLLYWCS